MMAGLGWHNIELGWHSSRQLQSQPQNRRSLSQKPKLAGQQKAAPPKPKPTAAKSAKKPKAAAQPQVPEASPAAAKSAAN